MSTVSRPASVPGGGDPPAVILFDGVCNLCHASVRFVIDRDPHARFRFAALQTSAATRLLGGRGGAPAGGGDLASVVLLEGGRVYRRSGAALRIARRLRWPWPLLAALLVVPAPIRDALYDWVARRRYRWFGRTEQCRVPTPELRARFLS